MKCYANIKKTYKDMQRHAEVFIVMLTKSKYVYGKVISSCFSVFFKISVVNMSVILIVGKIVINTALEGVLPLTSVRLGFHFYHLGRVIWGINFCVSDFPTVKFSKFKQHMGLS